MKERNWEDWGGGKSGFQVAGKSYTGEEWCTFDDWNPKTNFFCHHNAYIKDYKYIN